MANAKYPGIRVVANGNELVSYHTETRVADAGIFYPITPSTEMGELYQLSYAQGRLTAFGGATLAVETEGEHAAQGGAIAYSVTGKRVVNFTSGQGLVYGLEQYYHAPGKLSTMIVQLASRALTKHALNVHCGHDDMYAALDTGWIILMAKDAQQAADQSLILRKVAELALTPGINVQDGFLTSHLERTFFKAESELIREYLGAPDDTIDCPTPAQRELFGPTRRRVPEVIDLKNPAVIGPVQNQEHYMGGVVARRNNFCEHILPFLETAYREFGQLTGRHYGLVGAHEVDDADTVFVSLGSAAENIEAAVDHLRSTRGAKVGSLHLNVIRPFPEEVVVRALAGRKRVIMLERTDEALSTDNPMAQELRTVLAKAVERGDIAPTDVPTMYRGSYGLGSRDFRPEGIIGAYEYAIGERARADGRTANDSETYFTLGIKHPYEVRSDERPSLLPDQAVAVRLHSIGGWGMITTGKNLGAIIGALGEELSRRGGATDQYGRAKELLHVSANPSYGSEKKGAPTAYFLVVAPERIRVNCDLRHVDVVLCCDPKAFTHSNPLDGLKPGGSFVWESDETPEVAWTRIPAHLRQTIVANDYKLFILPGFDIARAATDRADLQLRMQGNAFLGAFFRVSPFLTDNGIDPDQFREVVRHQYVAKFGRFGDAVVESNMEVMTQGFERVQSIEARAVDAVDGSDMRGDPLLPRAGSNDNGARLGHIPRPNGQPERRNLSKTEYFDAQFRSGLGYRQPASALASVGTMVAATGATVSKSVARRETPVFIAENCTQCMNCIAACPDTALPNSAQSIGAVLNAAIEHYVTDDGDRATLLAALDQVEGRARDAMRANVKAKQRIPFQDVVGGVLAELDVSPGSRRQVVEILSRVPMAYSNVNAVFAGPEKKSPGSGALFSIVVSDLCKGCAECVTECGDHDALRMVSDEEEVNANVASAAVFRDLLPETSPDLLGLYKAGQPQESKPAVLRNHLMVRRNYDALVSGDGACAGCGEKTVLRAAATLTEAYMRPLYHAKAERLTAKSVALAERGVHRLAQLAAADPEQHRLFSQAVAHLLMGLGGESETDTRARIEASPLVNDDTVVDALVAVMRQDAFNHRELQAVDGRLANGMCVMAMGASTGCNTVYGSTPPNNPHPYPWMNSLFQDGPTVSWLFGESFINNHARRSVIPERLADALLDGGDGVITEAELFEYTHFGDTLMTDDEIRELPKAWYVGGDGATGDIGFQNTSKVVLQNRPNIMMLMLDTQVYSNTGGQNSDSSPLTGRIRHEPARRGDPGQADGEKERRGDLHVRPRFAVRGAGVDGRCTANSTRLMLDGLEYRGTAFFQCFTTCQPEHGVADDMSSVQAKRIRDSRGMPEFVFNPSAGETYAEAFNLKGNPALKADWAEIQSRQKRRQTSLHDRALGDIGGAVPAITSRRSKPPRRRVNARARRHARLRNTRRRGSAALHCRSLIGRMCRTSACTSKCRDNAAARRSFAPCRGTWCCSASSAAKRGACCRARPEFETTTIGPSAGCWPRWTRARSPSKSCGPTRWGWFRPSAPACPSSGQGDDCDHTSRSNEPATSSPGPVPVVCEYSVAIETSTNGAPERN